MAILRTRGILPHTRPGGMGDAGRDWATLFPNTAFEVVVTAEDNRLIVVAPDLSITSAELTAGDVGGIVKHLQASPDYSILAIIRAWAVSNQRPDLNALLNKYLPEPISVQSLPEPTTFQDRSASTQEGTTESRVP